MVFRSCRWLGAPGYRAKPCTRERVWRFDCEAERAGAKRGQADAKERADPQALFDARMIRALPLEVRSESRVRPTILTAFANAFEACVQTPGAGAEQRYGKRDPRESATSDRCTTMVDIGPGAYPTYPSDRPQRP